MLLIWNTNRYSPLPGHQTRNIHVSSYHNCVCEFLECLNGLLNAVDLSVPVRIAARNNNSGTDTLSFCHTFRHLRFHPFYQMKQISRNYLGSMRMDYAKICCESHKLNYFNWFQSLLLFLRSLHLLLACEIREVARRMKKQSIKNDFTFC